MSMLSNRLTLTRFIMCERFPHCRGKRLLMYVESDHDTFGIPSEGQSADNRGWMEFAAGRFLCATFILQLFEMDASSFCILHDNFVDVHRNRLQ